MKKYNLIYTATPFHLILVVFCVLCVGYLIRLGFSLAALSYHQQASMMLQGKSVSELSDTQQADALDTFRQATRYDSNHPEYVNQLGNYFLEYGFSKKSSGMENVVEQSYREAEKWLQKAVVLDPASPWFLYDLGRFEQYRGACAQKKRMSEEEWQQCPVTRYFSSALANAPDNIFLRATVAAWHYRYEPEAAFQLVREAISKDVTSTGVFLNHLWYEFKQYTVLKQFLPDSPEAASQFALFLYDKHLDYASDLEAQSVPSKAQASSECSLSYIKLSPDNTEVELGNDDGSAEWRTYLASEKVRVKKVLCLPNTIERYTYAAVKILMNSGNPGKFEAYIRVNEHLIKHYKHNIPIYHAQWHEIPFDIRLLQGKSHINIYVRVTDASASGDFLDVWGDHDTPTSQSVFNFDTTDDLSLDKGGQNGEYMIRLVLRRM